jgi:hypothetical protein
MMLKTKKKTTAKKIAKPVVEKRNRRSPYELLNDLKSKREALAEKTDKKLATYDAKIEALESRYKQRIAVDELKASMNPDELEKEMIQLKEKQRLLRMAMKGK